MPNSHYTITKKSVVKKSFRNLLLKHLLLKVFIFVLLCIAVVGVLLYFFILKDLPKASTIGSYSYPQSSKIYDRNGKLLYTIYASRNQTFAPLATIPKYLQDATISIEDKDFYHHGPIDFRGILRAAYSTLVKKQIQGGSTLTQQLVKTSLLTPEQTITRKIKEIVLSATVETVYSKSRILEMYLNQVPYGGTAWGVQAASEVYFDKPVSKLDLAEAAFLAGLPEAPSIYSPFGSHPELGIVRQHEVLQDMEQQGYITAAQEKQAVAEKLSFSKISDKILAPHFVFYVKDLLVQKYGQRTVEQGGLQVTTSLDLDLQDYAQATVAAEVDSLKSYNVSNGAAVITDPKTGEILAMIGSRDYFDTAHDGNVNVTLALRQPGSSIKPINYATGLMKGYTASTPFIDQKTCFDKYCPVNYDGKFHGVVQMRYALANSLNIPAVKMLKLNTVEGMIATADSMGINTFTDPSRYGLSLTLGGGEVRMIDMAEAFGVFANSGYKIDLHPILKVTDSHGKVLEQYTPPPSPIFGKKVLPDGVAFIISNILSDNKARELEFGPNSPLQITGYQVAVKTGTTNDFRDNWTIGYTPSYLVAVWVGNNDNEAMNGLVSGITGAAPIWHDLMAHLVTGQKQGEVFRKPDDVVGRTVCSDTGQIAHSASSCPTRFEYFLMGSENSHGNIDQENIFVKNDTQAQADPGDTNNVSQKMETVLTDPTGAKYCLSCAHPTPTPSPAPGH